MKVIIAIPTPLRVYTNNIKKIEVDVESVAMALKQLIVEYPKLETHLYENDIIRSYVNIYLNDDDVRYLEKKYETTVASGDTISIIPSIAGGVK
jgi:adenylyltransferase/sulfurtransferase